MQTEASLRPGIASILKTILLIILFSNSSTQAQSLIVDGKLQIADDASSAAPGQLRYLDGIFEGYNGQAWNKINGKPDTVQISINPFAFRPETNLDNWDISVEKLSKNSGPDSAIAILQLPNNAKIIGMGIQFLDNSPDDLQLYLYSTGDLTSPIVWYDTNINSTNRFYEEVPVNHIVTTFSASYFLRIKPEFGHEWDGALTCLEHVTIRYIEY